MNVHLPVFFKNLGELSNDYPCDPLPKILLHVLFDRFLSSFKQGACLGFVDTNPTYAVRSFLGKKFKLRVFYNNANCLTSIHGSAEAATIYNYISNDLKEYWHSLRNKGHFEGIPAKEKASYWIQMISNFESFGPHSMNCELP